ncbi:MAG: metallophosphoesterase, partial [Quisquiliibacterium sp.]
MSKKIFAIGDIQGCLPALQALVEKIDALDAQSSRSPCAAAGAAARPAPAQLWLVGDLVNRGPDSLGVLRWAIANERRLVTVLGNHDLHLLAVAAGVRPAEVMTLSMAILAVPESSAL